VVSIAVIFRVQLRRLLSGQLRRLKAGPIEAEFDRVAAHVQGELSGRGDTKAARAVGRQAATLDAFPNPHRVLWNGGRIPPTWKLCESEVPAPEVCRDRLLAEGIKFDEKDRASRAQYVPSHVLLERDGQEGQRGLEPSSGAALRLYRVGAASDAAVRGATPTHARARRLGRGDGPRTTAAFTRTDAAAAQKIPPPTRSVRASRRGYNQHQEAGA
jgi:hypothetical protein